MEGGRRGAGSEVGMAGPVELVSMSCAGRVRVGVGFGGSYGCAVFIGRGFFRCARGGVDEVFPPLA